MAIPFQSGAVFTALALALAACAGPSKGSQSVERVDGLLTRIERVQAESAVAKQLARAAIDRLCELVSPGFTGQASQAYAELRAACELSEEQGDGLRKSIQPMTEEADDVFRRWTEDLESFGNTRLRQRSQARLDETRARYQAIAIAAQAAQIALDGFHSDLEDHALYLGHDFNASAVASLRADVRDLVEELRGVDARLDATVAAARAYVESTALYGQVELIPEPAVERTDAQPSPAPTSSARKRPVTTLKPKSTSAAPATPAGATGSVAPAPAEPMPAPVPEPPEPDEGGATPDPR